MYISSPRQQLSMVDIQQLVETSVETVGSSNRPELTEGVKITIHKVDRSSLYLGNAFYVSDQNNLSSHLISKKIKITLILHRCINSPDILNWFKIWSAILMEEHRTVFETI
jgi:hypothetical protein